MVDGLFSRRYPCGEHHDRPQPALGVVRVSRDHTSVASFPQPIVLDAEAESAADSLSHFPGVLGVCITGSSARGDSDPSSDIDLLALIDDQELAKPTRRGFKGAWGSGRHVELKLVSEPRLRAMIEARSTFAVHVLREGRIAYDPELRITNLLGSFSPEDPVRENRLELRRQLEPYDEFAWCQGLFLYALADFYSVGRAATFTILGRESKFEFAAGRAFRLLARERPELASSIEVVRSLKPFYLLARRDQRTELPFPYRDSHVETLAARSACRTLVEAIR
jgi:predicted nucleotidyltransferase